MTPTVGSDRKVRSLKSSSDTKFEVTQGIDEVAFKTKTKHLNGCGKVAQAVNCLPQDWNLDPSTLDRAGPVVYL